MAVHGRTRPTQDIAAPHPVTTMSLDVRGFSVSRFHKIFLATALVVIGFGVAKFLGQPVSLPELLRSYNTQLQAAPLAQIPDAKTAGSRTDGSVQLLPDVPMVHADLPATRKTAGVP